MAPLLSKATYLVLPLALIRRKLSRYPFLFKVVDHQYLNQVNEIFLPKLFTYWFWGCPHPFR